MRDLRGEVPAPPYFWGVPSTKLIFFREEIPPMSDGLFAEFWLFLQHEMSRQRGPLVGGNFQPRIVLLEFDRRGLIAIRNPVIPELRNFFEVRFINAARHGNMAQIFIFDFRRERGAAAAEPLS